MKVKGEERWREREREMESFFSFTIPSVKLGQWLEMDAKNC